MIRRTPEGGFNTGNQAEDLDTPTGQAAQEGQGRQQLPQQREAAPVTHGTPPPPNIVSVQPGLHAGMQYPATPWNIAGVPFPANPWIAPVPGALLPRWNIFVGQPATGFAAHTAPLFRPTDLREHAMDAQIEGDSDDSDAGEDASNSNNSGLIRQSYTQNELNKLTKLRLDKEDTRALAELGNALPTNETVTHLTLDVDYPKTVRTTLQALHRNHTVHTLDIVGTLENYMPGLLPELTALLEKKTPLQHLKLRLWDWEGDQRKFDLDQAFFTALFSHPHLSSFKLLTRRLETISLHSPQELAARVHDNTSLRELHFESCGAFPVLFKAIAPGLEGNRSLQVLDLYGSNLGGCGPAMVSLLESNEAISALNLQASYGWYPEELEMVIGAVAENTALRELYFHHLNLDADFRPALGATIGAVLKSNQNLQSLSIHSKLDLANVMFIQQGLQANTGLRYFDPGTILAEDNAEGTTDATDALNDLFATNSRLTAAKLRPPRRGSLPPSANVLKGLERSLSIRSLSLWEADGVDDLISLLNNNPRITELHLIRFMPARDAENRLAETLEYIADRIQGNTTLLTCRFDFKDRNKLTRLPIIRALARFDALTARNRKLQREQQLQRIAAPALGLQMLSSFRHNDDDTWPALRQEEALGITTAIDSVLPQEEARRVLDVLRFVDIREPSPTFASAPQSAGKPLIPPPEKA